MNAGGGMTLAKGLNFLWRFFLIWYSIESLFNELFCS